MKRPRSPGSPGVHRRRAKLTAAQHIPLSSDSPTVEVEIRTLNRALQRQIGERLTQLAATCRELESELALLKRDEAELRRAYAQLERLDTQRELELSTEDMAALLEALREDAAAAQLPMPDSWPSMAGLDRQLSFTVCSGDRELLLRVLGQLCAELAELQAFDREHGHSEAGLAGQLHKLHKLQGSASTVGAYLVSAAAEQTLAAWRLGDELGQLALRDRLLPALQELRDAVAQLTAAEPARTDQPVARHENRTEDENTDQLLRTLIERLEDQRTDALELFVHIRSALSPRLTTEHLRSLQGAIEALQYERALELLVDYRLVEATTKRP